MSENRRADPTCALSEIARHQPEENQSGQLQRLEVGQAEEGARHNLGTLRRTVNVPTLPLFVLHPRHVGRFAFEPAGTETIDGTATTIVRFTEKRGPTFIQTPRHDEVFTTGRLWIAADGRVLQTALRVDERDTGVVVRIDVTYRDVPTIGLLMPAEMRESYTNLPGDRLRSIEGRATYGNYRTFKVVTNENVAPPASR